MASSIQQSPFLISPKTPSRNCSPNVRTFQCKTLKPFPFRTLKASSSSSSSSDSISPESSSRADSGENPGDSKSDRVKLAFEKAMEYKKKLSVSKSNVQISSGNGESKKSWNGSLAPKGGAGEEEKVSQAVKMTSEHEKNNGVMVAGGSATKEGDDSSGNGDGAKEIPETLRIAMEKAKEYKKNKEPVGGSQISEKRNKKPGSQNGIESKKSIGNLKDKVSEKIEPRFTDIDFMGLNFSEKKDRRGGLPPGLLPVDDPYAYGEMPEVEIIVGDASKFGKTQSVEPKKPVEDTPDLYKPQVSTWGVFPRPSNISKAYGGGRTLRPGEPLETPEVKAAKEARTKEMIAKYRASIGLYIDPKIEAECAKALKEGDALMDAGRLKEALPFYEEVMDKLVFQTELHGLAALQWSICKDSLRRPEEAQAMYKRLQSHPNAQVSKRARHFVFSFEAIEFMRLKGVAPVDPGYQPYIEAFVEEKTIYRKEIAEEEGEEGAFSEALLYLTLLASPIVLVLLMAVKKGV